MAKDKGSKGNVSSKGGKSATQKAAAATRVNVHKVISAGGRGK